jgi:hypothetical protein
MTFLAVLGKVGAKKVERSCRKQANRPFCNRNGRVYSDASGQQQEQRATENARREEISAGVLCICSMGAEVLAASVRVKATRWFVWF